MYTQVLVWRCFPPHSCVSLPECGAGRVGGLPRGGRRAGSRWSSSDAPPPASAEALHWGHSQGLRRRRGRRKRRGRGRRRRRRRRRREEKEGEEEEKGEEEEEGEKEEEEGGEGGGGGGEGGEEGEEEEEEKKEE